VSESEVLEKVIPATVNCAKNCKIWWMCGRAIASKTGDIFETQCSVVKAFEMGRYKKMSELTQL